MEIYKIMCYNNLDIEACLYQIIVNFASILVCE